jgi:hypothetical protein
MSFSRRIAKARRLHVTSTMTELDPEALRRVTGGLFGGRLLGGRFGGGRLFGGLRSRTGLPGFGSDSGSSSEPPARSSVAQASPTASSAPAASQQAPVRASGGCGS